MTYPQKVSYPILTVAQGQSLSPAIDLDTANAIGFVIPAALEATTAQMSFLGATSLLGTYKTVKVGGTKLALPIAVNDFAILTAINSLIGVRFLKVQLETAGGVAVAQASQAVAIEVIKSQLV